MAIDEHQFRKQVGAAADERWPRDAHGDRLRAVCADRRLWAALLLSLAEDPHRSPANGAAIAEARVEHGYRDCTELRTAAEWRRLGGTLRRSVSGRSAIAVTRRITSARSEGESPYRRDLVYPAECVTGLPPDRPMPPRPRGVFSQVVGSTRDGVAEVSDDAGRLLFSATEGVDMEHLTPIADYIVLVRYGGTPYPTPDPPDASGRRELERALRVEFRAAARTCDEIDRNLASLGPRVLDRHEAIASILFEAERPPAGFAGEMRPSGPMMTPDEVASATARILRENAMPATPPDRALTGTGGGC